MIADDEYGWLGVRCSYLFTIWTIIPILMMIIILIITIVTILLIKLSLNCAIIIVVIWWSWKLHDIHHNLYFNLSATCFEKFGQNSVDKIRKSCNLIFFSLLIRLNWICFLLSNGYSLQLESEFVFYRWLVKERLAEVSQLFVQETFHPLPSSALPSAYFWLHV